jgi:Glycosyl hydrolase family 3 C-terminal domain/Fibronectin type III-like domain/Glycosyl hydrolase family 3 N terminal domain
MSLSARWDVTGRSGHKLIRRLLGTVTVAAMVLSGVAVPSAAQAGPDQPWMDPSLSPDERVALLLPQMTLEEKVDLMTGDSPGPAGTGAYFNAAIPRLGIPELRTADIGPGVRFGGTPTTAFPMDIATAATWNPGLVGPLARAVADEARRTRHNMVLGPNVDIPRNPWWSRIIVQIYYGGAEQGRALADVLFGDINPSGKLPLSYPRFETQPTTDLGINNPLLTSEDFDVEFNEGVFVGYRGYERAGTRLQFPFGYGLSYTQFQYRNPQAENRNGQVSVSFTLRNTGQRTGAEVAQVYAGTLPTNVATPSKQLAGWAKVTLNPGESRRVTVRL